MLAVASSFSHLLFIIHSQKTNANARKENSIGTTLADLINAQQ